MIRLLAFLVLAGALAGGAFWSYLRAEPPVAGRAALALLRAAVLVVLLALVMDLRVPGGMGWGDAPRWVLVDVSASMSAAGGVAWEEARARAEALAAEGWTVVPFGEGVGDPGGLPDAPEARATRLAPALARALEAGAREVRVLSDLRFEDGVEAGAVLEAAPVPVGFEAFGGAVPNAGIASFAVDDQSRRGDPVAAALEFFAGAGTDSLRVEIREEGVPVLSRTVEAPAPARRSRLTLRLPAPEGEGRLRYTARVALPGDGFPGDDEAVAFMSAGREEGGLVLVTLRPDWDARALLSVLAEATGLPSSGWLRVGPNRFAPMGQALERGVPVDSPQVRAAAQGASLLVLHGLDARSDAWSRSLGRHASRVLLWPGDADGARAAGVAAAAPQGGEWYVVPVLKPSPLAADLAGVSLRDLPPLSGVLAAEDTPPGAPPLEIQAGGIGPARPALLLQAPPGRRQAVVLASGFWRWSARDGEPRETYRRLWAGVAGWLLATDPAAAMDVRPERWVAPARTPVGWRMPSEGPDSVRLEIRAVAGEPVLDTVLERTGGALTPPLSAGTYAFRATWGEQALGEGRFDVEARSEEMLPRPAAPGPVGAPGPGAGAGGAGSQDAGPSGGAPLRTSPWPYLLVLVLLSAEWVGRRRAGLR